MVSIKEARDAVANDLFGIDKENVTCVYIGHKRVGGLDTGVPAIVIGLVKKKPLNEVPAGKLIPLSVHFMGAVFPTDVVETGKIYALGVLPAQASDPSRTQKNRPAPPGVSVGHYKITAGTFGFVAIEKGTGREVAVSNEHVFTAVTVDNSTQKGDLILQQGKYDRGVSPDNDWAKLEKWGGLRVGVANYYDCAYAVPINKADMSKPFYELGKYPTKWKEFDDIGETVIKDGRSCGVATGRVVGIKGQVNVDYGRFVITFFEQILTEAMLIPGDSGSAILDANDYSVLIGLGFAGSNTVSIINPIKFILEGREPHTTLGIELPPSIPKKYLPSESDAASVKVRKVGEAPSAITVKPDKTEYYEGETINVSGKLTDGVTREGIAARDVIVTWDGNEIETSTDVSGNFNVGFTAPPVPSGQTELILTLKSKFLGDA